MEYLYMILILLVVIVGGTLLVSYISFRMAFYVKEKTIFGPGEFPVLQEKEYDAYRDQMISWMKNTAAMPHEEIRITSFDRLTLYGKLYEYAPDAPLEILFHGYRGSAERDLCGGVKRCFDMGHSALIVDQRASGHSGGNVITFGIFEYRDCLSWLEYATNRFVDRTLILAGVSMGATTVLLTADCDLPDNIAYILADSGFSSAKDIIKKVIKDMRLPADLLYPFVKMGARIFGGFDLEEKTALEAVKKTNKSIIFYHGAADTFVPCEMSRQMYASCTGAKHYVEVPGAAHVAAFLVDGEFYLNELHSFSKSLGLE